MRYLVSGVPARLRLRFTNRSIILGIRFARHGLPEGFYRWGVYPGVL